MDESDRPTDETKGLPPEPDDWVMPEPVFRSSKGRTPGAKGDDPELDATEPAGFEPEPVDAKQGPQSVRVREEERISRHKKKKGGCAKFFTLLALAVGLVIGLAIIAIIYFLFYWRPSSTIF